MELVSRSSLYMVFGLYAFSFFVFGWIMRGWSEGDSKNGGSPIVWLIKHKLKR